MAKIHKQGGEHLIQAAKALVLEKGFSALKMRDVAERAGVNLAMYHYYFKSKEAFLEQVIASIIADITRMSDRTAETEGPPLQRLRQTILNEARYYRAHSGLLVSILTDAKQGQALACRIFKSDILPQGRQQSYFVFEECLAAGLIRPLRYEMLTATTLGMILIPAMFGDIMGQVLDKEEALQRFNLSLPVAPVTDPELELSVDILITGLVTEKGRKAMAKAKL